MVYLVRYVSYEGSIGQHVKSSPIGDARRLYLDILMQVEQTSQHNGTGMFLRRLLLCDLEKPVRKWDAFLPLAVVEALKDFDVRGLEGVLPKSLWCVVWGRDTRSVFPDVFYWVVDGGELRRPLLS